MWTLCDMRLYILHEFVLKDEIGNGSNIRWGIWWLFWLEEGIINCRAEYPPFIGGRKIRTILFREM